MRIVWLPHRGAAAALRAMPMVRTAALRRAFETQAMKGFPYVPWYHGDFLRSTAGWTLTERAVYWMLLCSQCETGALPNDMGRLASIAGTDAATITSVWPIVGKKFKRTAAGLVNARMAEHRRNFIEFRKRQIEGGRKGAAARWKRTANVVPFRGPEGGHG
jgi:uncharacterized protein YdaU (DUF1376 family)